MLVYATPLSLDSLLVPWGRFIATYFFIVITNYVPLLKYFMYCACYLSQSFSLSPARFNLVHKWLLLPVFDVGANYFKFVYIIVGKPCFSALAIVVVVAKFERRFTVYTTMPRTHLASLCRSYHGLSHLILLPIVANLLHEQWGIETARERQRGLHLTA